MSIQTFFASGKLLLFGEYLVLRGAKALAVPVKYGQQLEIKSSDSKNIFWESNESGKVWLRAELAPDFAIISTTDRQKTEVVRQLLSLIKEKRPEIKTQGLHFRFDIDFDRNYGLGTSSTLVSLLSQWSGVDPFFLQKKVFNGSGYDIAAATAKGPLIYQLSGEDEFTPLISPVKINKKVSSNLLFVYTGKKQNSFSEVSSFQPILVTQFQINEMNDIVEKTSSCEDIETFEMLMLKSEEMLAKILKRQTVKETSFMDYPFPVKSLGAWGGDFMMASFRNKPEALNYFQKKGFHPVYDFTQLIKNDA